MGSISSFCFILFHLLSFIRRNSSISTRTSCLHRYVPVLPLRIAANNTTTQPHPCRAYFSLQSHAMRSLARACALSQSCRSWGGVAVGSFFFFYSLCLIFLTNDIMRVITRTTCVAAVNNTTTQAHPYCFFLYLVL